MLYICVCVNTNLKRLSIIDKLLTLILANFTNCYTLRINIRALLYYDSFIVCYLMLHGKYMQNNG